MDDGSDNMNISKAYEITGKYIPEEGGCLIFESGKRTAVTTSSDAPAVINAVNGLLTCGAVPKYVSAAFTVGKDVEEKALEAVAKEAAQGAEKAGVEITCGDVKMTDGSGVTLCATGIGFLKYSTDISPRNIRTGDAVVVADNAAPLCDEVRKMLRTGVELHAMINVTDGRLKEALGKLGISAAADGNGFIAVVPKAQAKEAVRILGDAEIIGNA